MAENQTSASHLRACETSAATLCWISAIHLCISVPLWLSERMNEVLALAFLRLPIPIQSDSNKAFCLGKKKKGKGKVKCAVGIEPRAWIMEAGQKKWKFHEGIYTHPPPPKKKPHGEQRERSEVDIWMRNPAWITTRCRLSVSRRAGWTRNLSDVRSTGPLIPN